MEFQGTTGRPSVRWSGSNILREAEGYSVPLNEWTQVRFVVRSGESVEFWSRSVGGEWQLRYSTTHSVVTPEMVIYRYGWQFGASQRVEGIHSNIEFRVNDTPFIHWRLDEGAGTVAGDSSGNGRHGQIQGPVWVEDVGTPDLPDAVVPSSSMPFSYDLGSVRFLNIRDDIGSGRVEIGVAQEGALPFIDEDITILSLPPQLAGNLALRTANADATWLFSENPQPVEEWTYFDAVPDLDLAGNPLPGANTTLADGSGLFHPGTTGRFNMRTDVGNNSSMLLSGGGDPVKELKTTVRGLQPGQVYPVATMFWSATNGLWSIRAGLEYGNDNLENPLFNPNSATTLDSRTFVWSNNEQVMTTEDNRVMYGAFLGHAVADEFGEIDVFVDKTPNDPERSWWDGVAVGSNPMKGGGHYLAFEVDRATTMYVINHPDSEPAWLTSTFSITGMTVETTAGTFEVWERSVGARELVLLPGNHGDFSDLNYWVVLNESPAMITDSPNTAFLRSPATDWSNDDFYWTAASDPTLQLHTTTAVTNVSNFSPEEGFRLTSTVRVPRLQEEGDNSIGFLLLGGSAAPIRAEWLPRRSGGDSVLRFVDTSNGSILATESWNGLVPTAMDNDVGVSSGAVEVVYSAGAPVFMEDAGIVVFAEDFATGGTGWTMGSRTATGGTNSATNQWQIGTPTTGPDGAFIEGTNVAGTNLSGNYATGGTNTEAWLRTPLIDLSDSAQATLRFHEFMNLDPFGAPDDPVHFGKVRVLDNDLEEIAVLDEYNEEILTWSERVLDLSGIQGEIVIEFALVTDQWDDDVRAGWYIDAIEITAIGLTIESMPEMLTLDGNMYGVRTERADVDATSEDHLQFTVENRGVSGSGAVTVYVAWDVRASGLEPSWLTQDFDRTDHYVILSGGAGSHRLWAREYAHGAEVTLGGASAGTGALGQLVGMRNYFVLLGDVRPGMEALYTLEASGAWTDNEGTLTFTLTDANGVSESVQTPIIGEVDGRNQFGIAVRHPDPTFDPENDGGEPAAPIWQIFSLAMDTLDGVPAFLTFAQWRDGHFTAEQINAGLADPDAAPAGDGVVNLLKYALDLSPLQPADRAKLPRLDPHEANLLILVYRERTDIDRTEIEYRPEVSENLLPGSWQGGPLFIEELDREPIGPNLEEVTVLGELPDGSTRGFIRLNIIQHE